MLDECLELFAPLQMKVFVEGTLGAGGHAKAILESHPEIEKYIAFDQDEEAIAIAEKELEPWKEKLIIVHDNFSTLDQHLQELGVQEVDGFFLTWGYHPCN